MDYIELSKIVSYALRHAPEKYNLILDKDGWANVNVLLKSLQSKRKELRGLKYDDLAAMIIVNSKKRHELKEQKIRALYGHSTKIKIVKEIVSPPDFLYHGTTADNSRFILQEGVKRMRRQYVHLSSNPNDAVRVAKRKVTQKIVVFEIRATEAFLSGVKFYMAGGVWLSDFIPKEFIAIKK